MIAFVTDHKFIVSPEGIRSNRFDNNTLLRYADIDDGLFILGRMVVSNDNGHDLNSGKVFFDLTNSKIAAVIRCLKNLRLSAVIVRLPSIYGYFQAFICLIFKKRYFVELVGDPYDSIYYSSGNRIMAKISRNICKYIVGKSYKTGYVNASKLPLKYPTKVKRYILSNVVLNRY